jgi:hypothetical protein
VDDSRLEFENVFQESLNSKITTGIQQLYIIGLYDALPVEELLTIFKTYLPERLFKKLHAFVTANPGAIPYNIHWPSFKLELDKKDIILEHIGQELLQLLDNQKISEKYVKTFHIHTNDKVKSSHEPTLKRTHKMVTKFFGSIYQRNILAFLVKYILLRPIIKVLQTSELMSETRGIFYLMHKRLTELIAESMLTAFNGSNYDNYLLVNNLIIIQSQRHQKIKIFKKGASISSILCINTTNFNAKMKSSHKKKKIVRNQWLMKLYIKDVRNLVAANMSLDKIGKLFNLPVSKLCFPYEQAKSIEKMKTINSLHPYDDLFWKDSFFGKTVTLDNRIEAQRIFDEKKFENLYEYNTFYLVQDCALLHSIVLTLFNTYMQDNINIFIRRNYSQSSLAYQQFFIIEPSKQIKNLLAPKEINNTFYNYLIKQAVTGGLCTSNVHGKIDKNITINDHFNYMDKPILNTIAWPNFHRLKTWKGEFNKKPVGIITLDIRSLYPSASLKKLPVNIPLFYSRFNQQDRKDLFPQNSSFYNTLNLNLYCSHVRESGNFQTDVFKLISKPPRFYNEFNALSHYLQSLPTQDIQILRFQSGFTAMGQLTFNTLPIDGFLSYKDLKSDTIHMQLIQYHSLYFHGHSSSCYVKNNGKDLDNFNKSTEISDQIRRLCEHYNEHFKSFLDKILLEYVEISDCQFSNHFIPKTKQFMMSFSNEYSYSTFLKHIFDKKLTGLLVVKNLKIKKKNQNPIFGFIIQKIEYGLDALSPYTQSQVTKLNTSKRVVSVHESKNFMVISTEYFNWLHNTFGFEETPDIYHALFFQLDYYLRDSIENKLSERKYLKNLIKLEKNPDIRQNYEVKAELIKLMLNSCYGFTLCNLSSQKFKQLENRRQKPTSKQLKKLNSCIQMEKNVFLIQKKTFYEESFPTLLGHVGCYILFNSKIILLKRMYFLLQFLNPRCAKFLYSDTDSAHFAVADKKLENNVDKELRPLFTGLYNKHFETGDKISGIWVEEGFYEGAEYLGEKCYQLYNESNPFYLTHMKGLNSNFQKKYHEDEVNIKKFPCIGYNIFFKSPDFMIFKTHMSKNLFSNYVPNKRYFVDSTGSFPLRFKIPE